MSEQIVERIAKLETAMKVIERSLHQDAVRNEDRFRRVDEQLIQLRLDAQASANKLKWTLSVLVFVAGMLGSMLVRFLP